MNTSRLVLYIAVMALVTYLPRVVPLALFRKKIKSPFLQSFLTYMPYGILAAMVFPAIFFSTASIYSAAGGAIVALLLAYRKKGLLTVALCATASVFLIEQGMNLLGLL